MWALHDTKLITCNEELFTLLMTFQTLAEGTAPFDLKPILNFTVISQSFILAVSWHMSVFLWTLLLYAALNELSAIQCI